MEWLVFIPSHHGFIAIQQCCTVASLIFAHYANDVLNYFKSLQ